MAKAQDVRPIIKMRSTAARDTPTSRGRTVVTTPTVWS